MNGVIRTESEAVSGLSFLPPVDVSNVPRDSASRAEMKSRRAAARYKLANVLFLSANLPDSAARWYRAVIEEDAGEPVALRAKYAMAEVHQALGDQEAADRLLRQIVHDHPESLFADRARVTLGLAIEEEAPDSLELALGQYEEAYRLWNQGQREHAIDGMGSHGGQLSGTRHRSESPDGECDNLQRIGKG